MSVDNMEVTGAINNGDLNLVDLSAADIEAGLFDDAAVTLFLVNWAAPDDGQIVLRTGNIGAITRTAEGQYKTELRGLAQRLSQQIVRTYGSSCDAELGDFRCKVNVYDYEGTGTVTEATNNRSFIAALDYPEIIDDLGAFVGGLVRWETGDNASYSMEVRSIAGVDPMPEVVELTSGSSWVAPAGATSVVVECWGGGGGGGGNTQTTRDGGGGGGGGAYSRAEVSITPGDSYSYQIGAGGLGKNFSEGADGTAGEDTWFVDSSTVMAKGGAGGLAAVLGVGGAGGAGGLDSGSMGDVKFSGGTGGRGRSNSEGRGGPGGSSAGSAANGWSGVSPWLTTIAGPPPTDGGIGGNGAQTAVENGASPVSGYGGGGGGSSELGGLSTIRGGHGAPGRIRLLFYPAATQSIGLYLQMPADIQAGDTFTIRPGCDKSGAMCKGRFDNLVNFRGHGALVPGIGDLGLFGGQTGSAFGRAALDALWLKFPRTLL